jgi:hypothetical protein
MAPFSSSPLSAHPTQSSSYLFMPLNKRSVTTTQSQKHYRCQNSCFLGLVRSCHVTHGAVFFLSVRPLSKPIIFMSLNKRPLMTRQSQKHRDAKTAVFLGLVWSCHVTDGAIFVLSSLCPSNPIIYISLHVT